MISAISGIIEKTYDSILDKKITKYSFLRGIRILSSSIILLLGVCKLIPIQLKYENTNLLNFINYFDNKKWFDDRCVYWVLIIGFLLFLILFDWSYNIAEKINNNRADDKDFLQKWAFFLTVSDAIEIIYSIYYLLLVCNKLAKYLIGSDFSLPIFFAVIHLGLFLYFAINNDNYARCKKSTKWKKMSPYCDSNGRPLYSEMKVFYNGKAYYVIDLPKSPNDVTKKWQLISEDRKSSFNLEDIDYHQILVAHEK